MSYDKSQYGKESICRFGEKIRVAPLPSLILWKRVDKIAKSSYLEVLSDRYRCL